MIMEEIKKTWDDLSPANETHRLLKEIEDAYLQEHFKKAICLSQLLTHHLQIELTFINGDV